MSSLRGIGPAPSRPLAVGDDVLVETLQQSTVPKASKVTYVGRKWFNVEGVHGRFLIEDGKCGDLYAAYRFTFKERT